MRIRNQPGTQVNINVDVVPYPVEAESMREMVVFSATKSLMITVPVPSLMLTTVGVRSLPVDLTYRTSRECTAKKYVV